MSEEKEQFKEDKAFIEKPERVRFLIHTKVGGFDGAIEKMRKGESCKVSIGRDDDTGEKIIIIEEKKNHELVKEHKQNNE